MVRGTWLLVALPLLLAAFTITRPPTLPPPALPPAFDAAVASGLARELAHDYPDRTPGSADALGAAGWVQEQLELYGYRLQRDRFRATIPGRGEVELVNLVAVVQGASDRAIVVTAHRDTAGADTGVNDNASGTAALIELARSYATSVSTTAEAPRPSHTLVFVSTDGGAFGSLGAARFAERSTYRRNALAVIDLDGIGGLGAPRLALGGDTARSPAASLVRTAAVRILEQSGDEPEHASALRQLLDLGFPFAPGEQGSFVARGIPAVTVGTVPEEHTPRPTELLDPDRLGELGRAAQNLIGSLDAGLELTRGTTSYVYLGTRVVRGWAIELVLLSALLPFAIGAIDLFARCRRRRIPLRGAVRNLRARLLFWTFAAAVILVAGRLGALPEGEARPLPAVAGVYRPSGAVLAVLGAVLVVAWFAWRERLFPRCPATAEETLAGHTVALLALGLLALLVVATNPFSLVYLLPSLYAWLWLPQAYDAPRVARAVLLVLGFAGPVILLLSFAARLELGLETPWYLATLVTVGYVPWIAVALGVVWCAIAAQLTAITAGRYAASTSARTRGPRPPLRLVRPGTGDEREALEG